MAVTSFLPDVTTLTSRTAEIHAAWTADPEMPQVHGCMTDAVRVLAVRAAVLEATGDRVSAALPAPAAVELSARLLERQFPELPRVLRRTGHAVVHGADGERWAPGDRLHVLYTAAFGPVTGRHWPM